MIRSIVFPLVFALTILTGCQGNKENTPSLAAMLADSPKITGKQEYASSPYVTSGNRVYAVGYQNGSFPELGWHIKGEMGGIWDHPIKLMDGFDIILNTDNSDYPLNKADQFTNYPFANQMSYRFDEANLSVERWQFVPDDKEGMLVQIAITNQSDQPQTINLQFTGHADLRPTWLGERTQMIDHQDEATFEESLGAWVTKDRNNPWYVIYGSDRKTTSYGEAEKDGKGKGISHQMTYDIRMKENSRQIINFVIAGSFTDRKSAEKSYRDILENYMDQFLAKQDRYQQLAEKSKLTIPDKQLEQTFEWLKYNSDWLVQTVPGIGTGIVAGLPDYPWWFGVDSEYALKGYMAIGQQEIALQTIALIDSLSRAVNDNGRIIHETSTNGAVFNPGNINETPQFVSLVWEVYRWTGDKEFLRKYFPVIKKGLIWLTDEKDANKNQFPDGFGMMEIHGLNSEMIDVAAYTQRAFADAANIAEALGANSNAMVYREAAARLKKKINEEFWSEEFQSYADFIGTDQQALQLIEDAIIRADTLDKPWAVAELKNTRETIKANPSRDSRPFVVHHNWVVNTPMEMGIATPERAQQALRTADKFVNPFGVFVTGIDRDASAGSDEGSFKGSKVFSYTGAVMTLPTGVQAVAEANYGNADRALSYIKKMSRTFSYALPGSMYEVSPDYGMFTQAWNIYGFAVPVIQQFFGISPDAAEKKIRVSPMMPSEWNTALLENVVVADNTVSLSYEVKNGKANLALEQKNGDWTLEIHLPKSGNPQISLAEDQYTVTETAEKRIFTTAAQGFSVSFNR